MTSKKSVATEPTEPTTYAIVGGGISGLYAAWRILRAQPEATVTVLEASERLGGRIESVTLEGIPFPAEVGAMRFRPRHRLLNALVQEFDLPIAPFDIPPPALFVRGRHLTLPELERGGCDKCGSAIPFLLRPEERNRPAGELVLGAIHQMLRELNFPRLTHGPAHRLREKIRLRHLDGDVWREIREQGYWHDIPLHSIGFWNLLQHFLSSEAFTMLHTVLSLESVLGNWNAAEAMRWFVSDFASDDLYMIPTGMEQLVRSLALQLGVDERGRPLSRVDSDGRAAVRMSATATGLECVGGGHDWRVRYSGSGGPGELRAKHVILALPQLALRRLRVEGVEGWPPPWLNWVRPHRLYKLFLLFEQPWWLGDPRPGFGTGRVFTDLPLRQIYYFSPKWMKGATRFTRPAADASTPTGEWSLVMASYSDEHYVSFWKPDEGSAADRPDAYLGGPYFRPPTGTRKGYDDLLSRTPPHLVARQRTVQKVLRMMEEIHGRSIPAPILGVFRDWGDEPFGGGWHTWEVGTRPWTLYPRLAEIPAGQVRRPTMETTSPSPQVCGEAYSNEQGWIEGALKTTERMLRRHFGVPDIGWDRLAQIRDLEEYLEW
jgi:monoamine oxidase